MILVLEVSSRHSGNCKNNFGIFGERQTDDIKVALTDMRYFARSKFLRSLVHKRNFWSDAIISIQVRILILSREVGYLF